MPLTIPTRRGLSLLAALLLPWIAGCSSVVSTHPIGEALTGEQLEQIAAIEGVWAEVQSREGAFHVKHVGEGKLALAMVGWDDDAGAFAVETLHAELAMQHNRMVLNVLNPDREQDAESYSFLLMSGDDPASLLVLHLPDADAFAAAVETGELVGTIEKQEHSKTVHLTGEKAALDEYLTPARLRAMFATESPVVYRRVAQLE